MSSKDVAGGIWRFLIGAVVLCVVAVIVFVGWLTDGVPTSPGPSVPISAATPTQVPYHDSPLPDFRVPAGQVIGRSRAAVRKFLGKPSDTDDTGGEHADTFNLDHGFKLEVGYLKGRGASIRLTGSIPRDFNSVRAWADLPEISISSRRDDWPGVTKGWAESQSAFTISGKPCRLTVSNGVLQVFTTEYPQ
jgi:hypothetical protein